MSTDSGWRPPITVAIAWRVSELVRGRRHQRAVTEKACRIRQRDKLLRGERKSENPGAGRDRDRAKIEQNVCRSSEQYLSGFDIGIQARVCPVGFVGYGMDIQLATLCE